MLDLDRRTTLKALLLLGLLLVAVRVRRLGGEGVDTILLEVEGFRGEVEGASMLSSRQASGGWFVNLQGWKLTDPRYGLQDASTLELPFSLQGGGEYQLWVRARWDGQCSNSVAVRLEGPERAPDPRGTLVGNDRTHDRWHWVAGPRYSLEPGEYVLELSTRETSANVDSIVLGPPGQPPEDQVGASAAVPTRVQLEAFHEVFTALDIPGASLTRWRFDGSDWSTVRHAGLLAYGPVRPGRRFATAEAGSFREALLGASMAVPPRAGAGLFFGRNEEEGDCYAVRLADPGSLRPYRGQLQVVRLEGDAEDVLASVPVDVRAGYWVDLEVWLLADRCSVRLDDRTLLDVALPVPGAGEVGLFVDEEPHDPPGATITWPASLAQDAPGVALAGLRTRSGTELEDVRGVLLSSGTGEELSIQLQNEETRDALDAHGSYAKRITVTLRQGSDQPVPIAERWGVFPLRGSDGLGVGWGASDLSLHWNEESLLEVPLPFPPRSVALLRAPAPRAFFGDFRVLPLDSKLLVPLGMVGGGSLFREEAAGRSALRFDLDREDLPLELLLDLDPGREPERLVVSGTQGGGARFQYQGIAGSSEVELAADELLAAPGMSGLTLLYIGGEVFIALGEHLVHAAPRADDGRIQVRMPTAEPERAPPCRRVHADEILQHRWESIGYRVPVNSAEPVIQRGPVRVDVPLEATAPEHARELRLRADAADEESGYRLVIGGVEDPGGARLFRGAAPVGRFDLPTDTDRPDAKLSLFVRGSRFGANVGREVLFSLWDPAPLQGTHVSWKDPGAIPGDEEQATRFRLWDELNDFQFESSPTRSLAAWEPVLGSFIVQRVDAYTSLLVCSVGRSGAASMQAELPAPAAEAVFEAKLVGIQAAPGAVFHLRTDAGEGVALRTLEDGRLGGELYRADRRVALSEGFDLGEFDATPPLVLWRSPESLAVTLDGRSLGRLDHPGAGTVGALEVALEGTTGDLAAVRSLAWRAVPEGAAALERRSSVLLEVLERRGSD